ncbi:hypothetical protein ABZZ74_47990 [Streptomyces sp. NPDC006476]|uniref:hypothetical protein n=1 Tax=Streptomyces sp. NPDC006476 TaxID=3157175 RepID=UPI0033A5C421
MDHQGPRGGSDRPLALSPHRTTLAADARAALCRAGTRSRYRRSEGSGQQLR